MEISAMRVVLLPYSTPHPLYPKEWGLFHPAALENIHNAKNGAVDDMTDWTGHEACQVASSYAHTVVATIPPVETPAGFSLQWALKRYVNPQNILAEIDCVPTDAKSIVEQMEIAFKIAEGCDRMVIVMPYQVFGSSRDRNLEDLILADGEATFAYTHQVANFRKEHIPECMVFAPDTIEGDGREAICKAVEKWDELDPMLRGSYNRIISMFEVTRVDFESFARSADYPHLGKLLKKVLTGKLGVMMNPDKQFFIA